MPCGVETIPPGGECRGDRSGRPVQRTNTTRPTRFVCQNDTIFRFLTSQFPDLPFSGNAHFRKIVPIRKTRVKYFKTRPSKRIEINPYSHNYTVSNAKKAFAGPVFTVEKHRLLASYGRVRTTVPTCPHRRGRSSVRK